MLDCLDCFACLLCLHCFACLQRRYHRRSKMKRRGVQNSVQNALKMAQKCLPNGSKMAPWRPLGSPWAPTLLPDAPRSRPGEALARPGASQKSILAALERPGSEKWIDFTLLGAPGEGPGGALGGHFGSFFAVGPAGTKNNKKSLKQLCFVELFLHAFSYRFRVCSVRLGARRRESTI